MNIAHLLTNLPSAGNAFSHVVMLTSKLRDSDMKHLDKEENRAIDSSKSHIASLRLFLVLLRCLQWLFALGNCIAMLSFSFSLTSRRIVGPSHTLYFIAFAIASIYTLCAAFTSNYLSKSVHLAHSIIDAIVLITASTAVGLVISDWVNDPETCGTHRISMMYENHVNCTMAQISSILGKYSIDNTM